MAEIPDADYDRPTHADIATTRVILEIRAERQRQIEVKGCTEENDDLFVDGELACAAFCYTAEGSGWEARLIAPVTALWPWAFSWWKPTTRRRNLIKAAALIVAEIERLDRAASRRAA